MIIVEATICVRWDQPDYSLELSISIFNGSQHIMSVLLRVNQRLQLPGRVDQMSSSYRLIEMRGCWADTGAEGESDEPNDIALLYEQYLM